MNWDSRFQAISKRGATSTASFGGWADGLHVPEEAKEFALPTLVGLAAGAFSKMVGAMGPAPIIVGLGSAALTYAVSELNKKSEEQAQSSATTQAAQMPASPQARVPTVSRPVVATQTVAAAVQPKGAAAPWPVLVPLSRGGDVLSVADVQNALNAAGFASPYLVVDGKAGTKTTAAVKLAQAKFGLTQTGSTADGNLKVKLQNAVADKASMAQAVAASDQLVAEMKQKGYA